MELHQTPDVQLVLFDIGGVLIDLHSDFARHALEKRYKMRPGFYEKLTRSTFETPLLSITEKAMLGAVTTVEYLQEFRDACQTGISISEIKSNRESVIGPERTEMIKLLDALSMRVRIAALTNTIELHWNLLTDRARFSFHDRLEKVIASHTLGLAKPMPDAYRFVARLCALEPANILFVDDSKINVLGATGAGMKAIQYTTCSNLWQALRQLSIL